MIRAVELSCGGGTAIAAKPRLAGAGDCLNRAALTYFSDHMPNPV